jgi:hypothetical protein
VEALVEPFLQYVRSGVYFDLWKRREWSEVLESVYIRLGACIREGCDTLIARPEGLYLFKDGRPADRFPLPSINPDALVVHYRDLMRIVRHRDPLVRERFRLVHEGPDGAVYCVMTPGGPLPDPATAELDRRDAEEAPVALLLGPPSPRARHPRESWGLRDRPVSPYDLATLRRASSHDRSLLIEHGVADCFEFVARADLALSHGVEEARGESVTSGWPPEELIERAQVKLEAAQAAVEAGRVAMLWTHHREAIGHDSTQTFIYLTGRELPEAAYLLLPEAVYAALVADGDQLAAAWGLSGKSAQYADVLIVRAGTVMAVLNPGFTGFR